MDSVTDLFGRETAIFVGLMIPFLGLLVPAIVLLVIGMSHRIGPHHASVAAASAATPVDATAGQSVVPVAFDRETTEDHEPSWLLERLRESDIFEGLTDDELQMVAGIARHWRIPGGARLAVAGSRGHDLFLIVRGEIRLLSHPPAEEVVRVASVGETVPLAAIIDPPVLVTTVETRGQCEVLVIPRQPFLDLLEANPMMGFQVYRAVAHAFEHRYRHTLDHLGAYDDHANE
jgi:hypothetical protein